MAALDWSQCPVVESVPGKVSGAWVLKGTRMPVSTILENIAGGATVDDILEWFEGLNRDQVQAVIDFAAEQERFLAAVSKGLAEAERGELIDEQEMDARLRKMLES